MMWIVYDPNAAFPQVPRPGEGVLVRGAHTPPAGLASFEFDAGSRRNEDVILEYRVTAADVLTRRDQADIDADALVAHKAANLTRVRGATNTHILASWPMFRQQNADAGIYPPTVKTQKDADIVACITECERVETAIDTAVDQAGVDAAVASLNLPALPVVI